jgi:hypothetical protein
MVHQNQMSAANSECEHHLTLLPHTRNDHLTRVAFKLIVCEMSAWPLLCDSLGPSSPICTFMTPRVLLHVMKLDPRQGHLLSTICNERLRAFSPFWVGSGGGVAEG